MGPRRAEHPRDYKKRGVFLSTQHSFSLTGKIILISGASRGIGAAIARACAAAGAEVLINYRSGNEAAAGVQADILAAGGRAHLIEADVAEDAARKRMWKEAMNLCGKVDVLINNAAIERREDFIAVEQGEWERQLAVNLTAPYFLSQLFARHRIEAGGSGSILNISSTHESRPMPRNSVYNISKAGLGMLTKSLAQELAPHKIRVNGLIPGAIRTDMNREVLTDPSYEAKVRSKIPLGWIAEANEIAAAAVFLASDEAAYITGSSITVDGGLSL